MLPQPTTSKTDSWENEGGSLQPLDYATSLGVAGHLTESFTVGGYRYTNLADAVAQARRMTQRERDVL